LVNLGSDIIYTLLVIDEDRLPRVGIQFYIVSDPIVVLSYVLEIAFYPTDLAYYFHVLSLEI